MATNFIANDRPRLEAKSRTALRPFSNPAEALDETTIADLSSINISRMPRDELLRVIRAARLPLAGRGSDERLAFYDRQTLKRLVYLARRCCHNRTTASHSRRVIAQGGV